MNTAEMILSGMHKQCSKCKELKLKTEFYSNPSRIDGLQSYCKKCSGANKYYTQKDYLGLPLTRRQYNLLKLTYAATHEQIEKHAYTVACLICGKDLPIGTHKHKHFDHCHTKGTYRGTLCSQCNRTLGTIEHDSHGLSPEEWCERTLKYLNEPHEE